MIEIAICYLLAHFFDEKQKDVQFFS